MQKENGITKNLLQILSDKITSGNKTQKYIMIGTLSLALFAFVTAIVSIKSALNLEEFYKKQIFEMKKSIRFDWRPFLDIEHVDRKRDFVYLIEAQPKPETKKEVHTFKEFEYATPERLTVDKNVFYEEKIEQKTFKIIPLDELNFDDMTYDSVSYLLLPHFRKIRYLNQGETPLRIKAAYISVLTQIEWVEHYNKSESTLVNDIPNLVDWEKWGIDYIVKSREEKTSSEFIIPKFIPKSEIETYFNRDSTMTLYWVSYFEYQDFFDNIYNTILIQYEVHRLYNIDNYLAIGSLKAGIEKYRWDVNIE
jgi:hypothetical protein